MNSSSVSPAGRRKRALDPRDELVELTPIEVTFEAEGRQPGDFVPVRLRASVTPVGTLLLEALAVERQIAAGRDVERAAGARVEDARYAPPGYQNTHNGRRHVGCLHAYREVGEVPSILMT